MYFDGWCSSKGIELPNLSMRRSINLYLFAINEWADEETLDKITEALEAPNVWDAERAAPVWWTSDEEAWGDWATAQHS